MTRVDQLLLNTLGNMGNVAPSKFRLLIEAGVGYRNGLSRIEQLAALGYLEIRRGARGAHVIIRREQHGT